MAADQVHGLHHGPSVPLITQGIQDVQGAFHVGLMTLPHVRPDHP